MSNTLGIDVTNFGNNDTYMFLYDPALYLDIENDGTLRGLGYMEAEKVFEITQEFVIFETGIPRTEVRRDLIRQEFVLSGMLKQVQKETIALLMQRSVDTTDSTWDRVIMGTELPVEVTPAAVLIGENRDGNEVRLYIRKLRIATETLTINFGAEEYLSLDFRGIALKDDTPLTTNPTWPYNPSKANEDNIAFWAFPKFSS